MSWRLKWTYFLNNTFNLSNDRKNISPHTSFWICYFSWYELEKLTVACFDCNLLGAVCQSTLQDWLQCCNIHAGEQNIPFDCNYYAQANNVHLLWCLIYCVVQENIHTPPPPPSNERDWKLQRIGGGSFCQDFQRGGGTKVLIFPEGIKIQN